MPLADQIKSAKKYITRLTPPRALIATMVVALVIVFLWPHAELSSSIVFLTAIPGFIAAALWSLTFWHKARVQIGRLQLRYRVVRHTAGIIALLCLPFLLARYVAFRIEAHHRAEVASEWEEYYKQQRADYRFTVAFAHLQGDEKDRLVNQLVEAMSRIDKQLAVSAIVANRTIPVSGDQPGIGHLDALGLTGDIRADVIVWGSSDQHDTPGIIFETDHAYESPFAGVYLPSDFRLPRLPLDAFCDVLRLVVATRSAERMHRWGWNVDNTLEPLIKQVQTRIQDTAQSSAWKPDDRARVYFVLGVATRISGYELNSRDALQASVSYFQQSLTQWTRENNPLEWAMTQSNLGVSLESLAAGYEPGGLAGAQDAYRAALAIYESKSDKLDSAGIQLRLGKVLLAMARRDGSTDLTHQAIEAYTAAIKEYDEHGHPQMWASIQIGLGDAWRLIADQKPDAAVYGQAIAAYQAALRVYKKEDGPGPWAAVEQGLATCLADRGQLTSNLDDLRQAVAISREITEAYPREFNPVVWASLQTTLGHTLSALGGMSSNVEDLRQAGAAFTKALSELSPSDQPEAWAEAQDGLAGTFDALGEKTSDSFYFGQSVDAYQKVLTVYTREKTPTAWAWAKYNLAGALFDLGVHERGTLHLRESVQCYREALSVLSQERNPVQWKQTQDNLQTAMEALNSRGG